MDKKGAALGVILIWCFAISCASPNYIWREMALHEVGLPGLESVAFCFEKWPFKYGRAYYSAFVLMIQLFFPIVTVSLAYCRISKKLSTRRNASIRMRSRKSAKNTRRGLEERPDGVLTSEFSAETDSSIEMNAIGCAKMKLKTNEDHRVYKVNLLLIAITVVFCISWLPLNLYNLIMDVAYPDHTVTEKMLVVYAACHLCGMSSACSNPFLYGWLNHNFRHEFSEMFLSSVWKRCTTKQQNISVSKKRTNLVHNNITELVVKDGDQTLNPTPVSAISQTLVTVANQNTDIGLDVPSNGAIDHDLLQRVVTELPDSSTRLN